MEKGQVHVYNLGTGKGYSVLEMAKAMRDASGKEIELEFVDRRAGTFITLNHASHDYKLITSTYRRHCHLLRRPGQGQEGAGLERADRAEPDDAGHLEVAELQSAGLPHHQRPPLQGLRRTVPIHFCLTQFSRCAAALENNSVEGHSFLLVVNDEARTRGPFREFLLVSCERLGNGLGVFALFRQLCRHAESHHRATLAASWACHLDRVRL